MSPEISCANSKSLARDPKMFNLYLESRESSFPNTSIKVSEFQLLDAIRVLSQVYFVIVTD